MMRLLRFGRRGFGLWSVARVARHLPTYLKLMWGLYKDPRVPAPAKAVLAATFAYLANPVDILPDFIPGLGQIDDALVVVLAWGFFKSRCPQEVWQEHLERIRLGESDFDHDLALIRKKAAWLFDTVSRRLGEALTEAEGKEPPST